MSVIGGLLLFIGVELLDSWVIKVRKRLHWSDYVVILIICVTIVVFGFVEGRRRGNARYARHVRIPPQPCGRDRG